MQPSLTRPFLALLGLALASANATAAELDTDAMIKYRQQVMKGHRAHFSAIDTALKAKLPVAGQLLDHARALRAGLGMVKVLFPDESDFGETDAKPEIWEQRPEFDAKADDAVAAADALVAALASGAGVAAAMDAVSDGCKGCHKPYREQ